AARSPGLRGAVALPDLQDLPGRENRSARDRPDRRKTGVARRARRASKAEVKRFVPLLFLSSLLAAQTGVTLPRVGVLDYYGLHKVSPARIQRVLATKEGDPFPNSKGDVEERLEKIPGVVRSHLEAVCCDGGKAVLFVGIEEKGAAHFE